MTSIDEKPLEELSANEIKEMFLDLFFWVAENRSDWLQEAIERKKRILGKAETERRLSAVKHQKR